MGKPVEGQYGMDYVAEHSIDGRPHPDPEASGYGIYFLALDETGYPPKREAYHGAVDAYASEFRLDENQIVPAVAVVYYLNERDLSLHTS